MTNVGPPKRNPYRRITVRLFANYILWNNYPYANGFSRIRLALVVEFDPRCGEISLYFERKQEMDKLTSEST